jgi:hypothetical protein
MNLSTTQITVLRYLDGCERATPRTIRRITGASRSTILALERRRLVAVATSVGTGIERVYITEAGRKEIAV